MAPAIRVRPYKDFLTPALHRRFAMATASLMGLCYVESLLIGEWKSMFWSWFPIGIAGIRTLLLFIPAFMIFILRVAQLHVGYRTSYSAWDTFRTNAAKFQVVQTVGWYALSAYLFSEIYIWSAPKSADLNRIKLIPKTDRTTLNEQPIYLTGYLIFVAVVQAAVHLYYDYDRLDMPSAKTQLGLAAGQALTPIIPPAAQLKAKFVPMMSSSLKLSVFLTLSSPILYSLPFGFWPYSIRKFAWSFTRSWAKIFWNLPKSGSLPTTKPFHWTILVRTFTSGFMLLMLWELGNAAFTAYVAQEPLKNDRPITYESRDPNGSLLTGLKGKKLQTRAFAFWELVYIGDRFEGRRKGIFEDIDRKGGSAWSQILEACLEVVTGIEKRIADHEQPPVKGDPTVNKDTSPNLPRLTQPLQEVPPSDLFGKAPRGTRRNRVEKELSETAKALGQSPEGNISPKARKLLESAESAILTPEQKAKIEAGGVVGLFRERATKFLQTPAGIPFRQEYRRKLAAIVLGSPFGDVGIIVDAVDAMTRFSVASLKEDKYGNVQRDVPLIIRTLTTVITKLEKFQRELKFHWTDVEKKKECPEVDAVLVAMKTGLTELINAFGDYSSDLRLSQAEMRAAREAALLRRGPEMEQR